MSDETKARPFHTIVDPIVAENAALRRDCDALLAERDAALSRAAALAALRERTSVPETQGDPRNVKPIILCAGENGRALVYGYVESDPVPAQPVRMERARMILYYPSGGTFGLAAIGPPEGSRVTHAVSETVETRWQEWIAVSKQAASAFDEGK